MGKSPLNPNARKALDEMKIEIANELGLPDTLSNDNPVDNIFTAGPVGGVMTRKLVEMGEKQLIDRE
ncbi:alpha/beta-type small acid-soluble spore protein [Tissierella sp. MSJ-40]|uniref:Alpha/beta-type small acid-soluble spore protein n=1 Tax=Tissierella simiarum TaxID=2841534 RepID=A0ABS6EB57_9FIRM|nr:alpha/beta-type small acid-soluble spore protein [Tissierella simiarum]MBU5440161.1 alpha/beta-type small acid-soluble spore protein [Tissierella simiarum]